MESVVQNSQGRPERLTDTDKPSVISIYESQIEELTKKKEELTDTDRNLGTPDFDFKKAVDEVFEFIKEPLVTWRNKNLGAKHALLKILFRDLLPYGRNTGFGTLKNPYALTLFGRFLGSDTLCVTRRSETWNTVYRFISDARSTIHAISDQ